MSPLLRLRSWALLLFALSAAASAQVTETVSFSREGGLLAQPTTLSAAPTLTPGAEVRYTLDNTEPTAESPLLTAPLEITESTIVRARVVVPGTGLGPVVSRQFLRLDESLASYGATKRPFTSSLPIVVVGTYGGNIDGDREYQFTYNITLLPGANHRASLADAPEYQGRGGMHLRGETSAGFPQKSYAWETRDEAGADADATILEMPAESDWILYAPYTDKALMRNLLTFSLMRELRGSAGAVRTRFCELFVNTDPGQRLSMADYRGVYVLMEKIKHDKNRINIAKLDTTDTDPSTITGGYIFREDKASDGYNFYLPGSGREIQLREPEAPNDAQAAYVQKFWTDFQTALDGPDFTDPTRGYAAYVEPNSFIDNQWFVEVTKQIDGYRLSSYFTKDRGRRMRALPLWDYNLSMGNADYLHGDVPTGWYYEEGEFYPWYPRMHEDPAFDLQFWDRYFQLRRTIFSNTHLRQAIASQAKVLTEGRREPVTNKTSEKIQTPAARHFRCWPILGEYVWPNGAGYAKRTTFQSEVASLQNFLLRRLQWLDGQNTQGTEGAATRLFYPPKITRAGGTVTPGVSTKIVARSGKDASGRRFAAGQLYYTTDGRDPRGTDGTPQGSLYQTAVRIPGSMTLKARLYAKGLWGPLAQADYLAGALPPTAERLTISEVMYHPANPNAQEKAAGFTTDSFFEWIELANTGTAPVDLSSLKFLEGIEFDFANVPVAQRVLAPGAAAVLVSNPAAFALRYPNVPPERVLGTYTGNLSNGGEKLRLGSLEKPALFEFTYDDVSPWPLKPDGDGPALEVAEPAAHLDLNLPGSWRASVAPQGTPGEL